MTAPKAAAAPDEATKLAIERTALAIERTTMAWIRTSVSLIAFGFTIFKFFEYRQAEHHRTVVSPWIMGMIMITSGLVALVLAWIQHRQLARPLRRLSPDLPFSLASVMAGFIVLLGVVALVIVGFRL